MGRKLTFALIAFLLLVPWPTAYAYSNHSGAPSVRVEAASGDVPAWMAYGGAIGGVTNAIDLFFIDTTDYRLDVPAVLYLTNAFELRQFYRYIILKIRLYTEDADGRWQVADAGRLSPDTYLTMLEPQAGFLLKGDARHKITVDSGSFRCYPAECFPGEAAVPAFYLSVKEQED